MDARATRTLAASKTCAVILVAALVPPVSVSPATSAVTFSSNAPGPARATSARHAASVEPDASSDGLRIEEEWYFAIFGEEIGTTGLSIADLDGSGSLRIVAAASVGVGSNGANRYWYILSHLSGRYYQEWISPLYAADISAIRTLELDGTPGAEIVVAAGGDVFIYDGATRALLRTIETGKPWLGGLEVADADGDGELELVFCGSELYGGQGLHIHDLATGRKEYRSKAYQCSGIAVGNVDDDPGPEIVLGDMDSPGYVLDGATRLREWTYPSGFGALVRLGDIDGDGREEIVAGANWSSRITIYDGELRSPTWDIPTDGDPDALRLVDVSGDGLLEIVYGDSQWGSVYVWDPRSRALEWSMSSRDPGVSDIAVGDTDGDGVNEILWSSGGGYTGPDHLYVASTVSRRVEWRSPDVRGPFRGLDFGDVDHDGMPELLIGSTSSNSYFDGGILFVHDARTKALEHRIDASPAFVPIRQIRHANVDGDRQAEILVTTGVLTCYDGITHREQWRWSAPDSGYLNTLEIADVDGDGELEIVLGQAHYVLVLDAATRNVEWRSVFLEGVLWSLGIDDVDDDANLEILAAARYGRLYVHDAVTHAQELQTEELAITALATADLDGDGTSEILIGTSRGKVATVDPLTGAIDETLGSYRKPINALAVVDLTEDFVPDLVLALDKEVVVYDGRLPSERLWRSGLIGSGVGEDESLRVADLDEDGKLEILVNLGVLGLKIFQVETATGEPLGRIDREAFAP